RGAARPALQPAQRGAAHQEEHRCRLEARDARPGQDGGHRGGAGRPERRPPRAGLDGPGGRPGPPHGEEAVRPEQREHGDAAGGGAQEDARLGQPAGGEEEGHRRGEEAERGRRRGRRREEGQGQEQGQEGQGQGRRGTTAAREGREEARGQEGQERRPVEQHDGRRRRGPAGGEGEQAPRVQGGEEGQAEGEEGQEQGQGRQGQGREQQEGGQGKENRDAKSKDGAKSGKDKDSGKGEGKKAKAENGKSKDKESAPAPAAPEVRRVPPKRHPRTRGVRYTLDAAAGSYTSDDGCSPDNGYGSHRVPGGRVRNPRRHGRLVMRREGEAAAERARTNLPSGIPSDGFSFRNDPGFLEHSAREREEALDEERQRMLLEEAWASLEEKASDGGGEGTGRAGTRWPRPSTSVR
ncbi:hypothetical protein THAOC_08447, partial [Thalassiosira oceanica]